MTIEKTVTIIKDAVSVADEVRGEIIAVANTAGPADQLLVSDIITKAKAGKRTSELFTLTPAASAIIFLDHNPHNRDWRPDGAKSSREYQRRMASGQWMLNNACIGFYEDGKLADGQHRLSASALAGHALNVPVVFGMARTAIVTVDDGLNRHAADAVTLDGIQGAKAKQTIIKVTAAYLVKVGNKAAALRSEADIAAAIKANNDMLDEAITIGTGSLQNIVDPVLKATVAHALAYLMLAGGWSEQRTKEKLALFQTGVSADGEKTPYFVAAEVIKKARRRSDAKERLTTIKELGVAVFAMVAAERGIKAIGENACKTAVKKELPNPAYPAEMVKAAA